MIKKKKIRSINPYIRLIPDSKDVYAGVVNPSAAKLQRIGFSASLQDGETILPRPVGKVTSYNANGMRVKHTNMPMETAYRTVEWHWTELHGRTRVEQSDFRDVPYKRYPRTHKPAPSLQLSLFTNTDGQRVVLAELTKDWRNNEAALVHATNVMLEIFGESTFFDDKREQIIKAPVTYLNWKILPKGNHPFPALKKQLEDALRYVKTGNRSFVDHRLERINSYEPEFTAVGQGGFTGYVIFGFPKKGIYVLESILYGNATYVLGDDWEKLSKLSKAEILNDDLHKDRIVHLRNWFEKIRKLLV